MNIVDADVSIVVSVDLTQVKMLVNTLTKFLSHFAPKPPVFEIRTLAFGILMAAIGLGLGGGVGLCGMATRMSRARALPRMNGDRSIPTRRPGMRSSTLPPPTPTSSTRVSAVAASRRRMARTRRRSTARTGSAERV